AVVISLAELDLAEEVVDQRGNQQVLYALLPAALTGASFQFQVPGLLQHLVGPLVVVLSGQHVPEGGGRQGTAEWISRLVEQRQALLEGRACLVLVAVSDEGEAGTAQGQGT